MGKLLTERMEKYCDSTKQLLHTQLPSIGEKDKQFSRLQLARAVGLRTLRKNARIYSQDQRIENVKVAIRDKKTDTDKGLGINWMYEKTGRMDGRVQEEIILQDFTTAKPEYPHVMVDNRRSIVFPLSEAPFIGSLLGFFKGADVDRAHFTWTGRRTA